METTLLCVDDERNILNALMRLFRKEGYNILIAESGAEALELLKSNKVNIVISDHRMPGMDGVEFLSRVKEAYPESIRFMLTGYADIGAVMGAINKGQVYKYITKPWNDEDLKFVVRDAIERFRLMEENRRLNEITRRQNEELKGLNKNLEAKVEEKTRKIRDNFFAFVRIVADLIELYDPHIGGHNKRVARMSRAMAMRCDLDEAEADLIETAALLHNIGLVGIPREIIEKDEESLLENERAILRHNPILSQDLLSTIDTLRQAGIIIRSHMERYDGKGYPDGLRGEEIHLGARILSVCKMYDNLRHGRRWRPSSEAIVHIEGERGGKLDPALADSFVEFLMDWKEEEAGLSHHPAKTRDARVILNVAEIKPGMVLEKNLVTGSGRLLVTKGTVLTRALIEKVLNFNRIDPILEGVHVSGAGAGL